ncbi:hypothetical protein GUJ93_ZPchr0010g10958 [Zizania palustris]|uniref:Uncharacterized protein n=1 Tax=Zizania palustris TaxID=103762 RepID=A0A8J6BHM5_ZIZPA|nr:hypothetical protein GUJ93_ZPchr0010g10958 [Zizania palustris]
MVEELLGAEGDSFLEEEIVDFCLSLLIARYETTSTLFARYETTSMLMTATIKFLTETPAALTELKV